MLRRVLYYNFWHVDVNYVVVIKGGIKVATVTVGGNTQFRKF